MNSSAAFSDKFHHFHFRQSRCILAGCFFVLGLNYVLSDYDPSSTFGLSPQTPAGVLWAERAVIMPISFALVVMLLAWGARRWMEWAVIAGSLAVGCAMVTGRRIWQLGGSDFPVDYSIYLIFALTALAGFGPRICFKPYNDRYGHLAGDRALEAAAAVLAMPIRRPMDLVARMGGEEFACLWYDVTPQGAQQLGDNLVERVRKLGIEHGASTVGPMLTTSAGIHHCLPRVGQTLSTRLHQADSALYAAKSAGRDRALIV